MELKTEIKICRFCEKQVQNQHYAKHLDSVYCLKRRHINAMLLTTDPAQRMRIYVNGTNTYSPEFLETLINA